MSGARSGSQELECAPGHDVRPLEDHVAVVHARKVEGIGLKRHHKNLQSAQRNRNVC